jgi:hypothetical protein
VTVYRRPGVQVLQHPATLLREEAVGEREAAEELAE